jgi:TP901 family phage tail tape measure protein
MAEIAKGIIDIEINTGSAASQLQALQAQINAFNLALNKGNKAQATFSGEYSRELQGAINKTGLFTAETVRLQTAAATLDKTLSKGKTSLGQFFSAKFNKNSAIAAETMALAGERAKRLQTQFIATSGAANGFQEALAVRPLAAFSSQAAVAAQKTQILSNMFRQGTTQLINFGKNVQWAGRQLMVGFTVPLTIFGSVAGKTFMDLEKQVVGFKKVYGDLFTTPADLEKNLEAVKGLASEYTKYGIAVKNTIGLAAEAAAAGRQGSELTDTVSQSTRLATLGQMDQNAALETTISLQSAFKLSGQELADTVNFLNMVENQTVVSLQDIATAIPRVAPVIQGLGGDVKDLTVFLAAMQEGGVQASEGANALKSGLASLINPTKQASAMLSGMGINLDAIIQANKGDLMGTVTSFSEALATLDQFSKQQALEQVFGKFQYAKLGALFENITREGSQAQQVISTLGYTTEQLAATADKELKTIEESFGVQLTGAVERFKLAIAPIGELFVKLAIPIVNFATKLIEGFNGLTDGQKKFTAIAAVIVGVVIPAATMMAGLFLNLVGTLAKIGQGMALFGKGFITGGPVGAMKALTQSSKYLSLAEMDAAMAAQQLSGASQVLNATLIQQVGTANAASTAIANLTRSYTAMIATQRAAGALPSFGVAAAAGQNASLGAKASKVVVRGLRRSSGGGVPGSGNTDTVPAMLTPGEFVVNKESTRNNLELLKQINNGSIQRFSQGGNVLNEEDAVRNIGFGATGKKTTSSIRRSSPKQQTGMTFAHMQRNLIDAKTPQGRQYFDDLYRLLSENGMLKGNKVATYEHGSKSGWKGWRVTGNLGFDVSRNTTLSSGEIIKINSKLNSGGIPANVLLEDLNKNFSSGKNPYSRMLRNVGIKDKAMIQKISSLIHNRVTQNLASRGSNTVLDSSLYKDMTKITVQSMRDGLAGDPNKKNILKNLFAASEVRTGKVPRLSDPNIFSDTKYGISRTLSKLSGKQANLGRIGRLVLRRNSGGSIPGSGNTDTVPAMLTPGEFVVNKKATSQNQQLLEMMNGGKVKGYADGGIVQGEDGRFRRANGQFASNAEIAKFQKGTIGSRAGKLASSRVGGFAGTMVGGVAGYSAGKALTGGNDIGGIIGSIIGPKLPQAATAAAAAMGVSTAAFVGIAAPLALAGFAIYKFNKGISKAEKSGAEFTNAMYGTAKTIEGIAEQFGTQTNAQTARIAAVERVGGQVIGQEAKQQSAQFVQSDAGKQMLQDVGTVKAGGGNAVEALRNQLSAAIISGAIGTEEARAIAVEVGTALGDQSIAIQVSGELTRLMGPDGGDLLKNLSSINAEISPKIDANKLAADATSAYEKMNVGEKFVKLFQGGEQQFVNNFKIDEISAANASAFAKEAQARELLNLAYQEGTITLKEFQAQSSAIGQGSASNQNLAAQALGFQSQNELVAAAGMVTTKNVGAGKGVITTQVGTEEQKQAKAILDAQKKEVQDFLTSLPGQTEDTVEKLSETIGKLGAGAFGDLLSGKIRLDDIPILVRLDEQGLSEEGIKDVNDKLQVLRKIPDLSTIIDIKTTSQAEITQLYDAMVKFDEMPDKELNIYAKDNFTGIIQQAGATYDQFAALPDLEKRLVMVKMEALVEVRAGLKDVQLDAGARKDYAKEVSELMQSITGSFTAGPKIGSDFGSGGSGENDLLKMLLERFKLQEMLIDKEAEGFNERVKQLNREIELEQRQVSLRQKGLDKLSKKEKDVNDAYNLRVEALDKVSESNSRISQQEKSRISLASALASGDIAAAASISGEIQQQSTQYQIEDARAALEKQRQSDLESLTVSINGKLMTRKDIEFEIETIQDRVYARGLEIQGLQDQLLVLEDRKLAVAKERERVETRMYLLAQQQAILDLKSGKGGKLNAADRKALAEYKASYNQVVDMYNAANPGARVNRLNYGGSIAKMAYGGIAYKGSTEPPPAMRMAFGSTVPGKGMTDKVSALLTPGEFVVRKSVADKNRGFLEALNSQVFPGIGRGISSPTYSMPEQSVTNIPVSNTTVVSTSSPMYNSTYNVNVNVSGTNASPDDIANVVMAKLSNQNRGSIRSNRY